MLSLRKVRNWLNYIFSITEDKGMIISIMVQTSSLLWYVFTISWENFITHCIRLETMENIYSTSNNIKESLFIYSFAVWYYVDTIQGYHSCIWISFASSLVACYMLAISAWQWYFKVNVFACLICISMKLLFSCICTFWTMNH